MILNGPAAKIKAGAYYYVSYQSIFTSRGVSKQIETGVLKDVVSSEMTVWTFYGWLQKEME